MNIMRRSTWLIIILMILFYFLYQRGYMVTKATKAVKFVGSNRGKKASYTSCTGMMKRIVRFKESKLYEFTLYLEEEKGTVEVFLLDSAKNELLKLNRDIPVSGIMLDSSEKYTLVIRFQNATGYYELDWDSI